MCGPDESVVGKMANRPISLREIVLCLLLPLMAGAGTAAIGAAIAAQPRLQVSQRGRDFQPRQIAVEKGETIEIVNDDADLLHHAYISSPSFNYDSGDMEPGGKAAVTFTVAGSFNILCAIHPKMKLAVTVK